MLLFLLLDGPQGWKSPQTGIPDMRICEPVLNTPGKVGEIGFFPYTGYLS
jgi:hypothetical protein